MVRLGELVMILELHREGVSVSDIARRTGLDRKTVRKYIARGLEPPVYSPRPPRPLLIDGFAPYLRERVAAFPELTGRRLWRELRDLGFSGDYTTVTGFLRDVRPATAPAFERRFETPPGRQGQVDFAHFRTEFADDPGQMRVVWLFSMVLGHSRLMGTRRASAMGPDLGAFCRPPGPANRAPVPRGGLRGLGRRAGRDPA